MSIRHCRSFSVASVALSMLAFSACAAEDLGDEDLPADDQELEIQAIMQKHPDAKRIDARAISMNQGKVILTFPERSVTSQTAAEGDNPVLAQVANGCPMDWYCLFDDINYGGRRLQFKDPCNDLINFNFMDRTSSWTNNTGMTLEVGNRWWPDHILWYMSPFTANPWVGEGHNDQADFVQRPGGC